jgi:hypothetical protein
VGVGESEVNKLGVNQKTNSVSISTFSSIKFARTAAHTENIYREEFTSEEFIQINSFVKLLILYGNVFLRVAFI